MRGSYILGFTVLSLLTWAVFLSESSPTDKQAKLRLMSIKRARLKSKQSQIIRTGAGSWISDPRQQMQGDMGINVTRNGHSRKVLAQRRPVQGGSRNLIQQDDGTPGARARVSRMPSSAGSPNLLASFVGKNRLLVISAPHDSDGYYRLMMSLLKPEVYCELAERHVHQIVMFHQEGEMGGKIRRITNEGKVMEEPLDTTLIPRLMNFLKLEKGKFGMVLLKKTLQLEERYPYPVRLEAVYEVIDQSPMRKMEKVRQKGFVQKCKGAGVEGQVVEGVPSISPQVDPPMDRKPGRKEVRKPIRRPSQTTTTTTPTPTIPTTTTTTTTKATTTTTSVPTTTTTRSTTTTTQKTTTTTQATTTQRTTRAHTTPQWIPAPKTTTEPYYYNRMDRYQTKSTTSPTTLPVYYTKANTGKYGTDKKEYGHKHTNVIPTQHKLSKVKPSKKKNGNKGNSNSYKDKYNVGEPTNGYPEEEAEVVPTKKGKGRQDKTDKKKKKDKTDKLSKKDKAERRGKDGKGGKKNGKKVSKNPEKEEYLKPTKRPPPPKGTLATFLDYFESKRRLILITAPAEENNMYVQQRDEYLEHVCEMAIRKISIITIFGTLTNSTMKIDHYQLENDKPMKGLRQEDLENHNLITELRKEYGMTYNDFFMVLTDLDMKGKHNYEVPIAMKAVFDHIDTFFSRIREMEQQKRDGVMCKKEDKPRSLENFLSRFRWRRRLFVISAPDDEEWSYQQQLYALTSQACNLGLRHVSILKLVGTDLAEMGGVLELYPINGTATVEREGISASLVRDIRNYFQISPEYFSMLLVGKDGNVKSWYPSPMWSMAIIYDLIDSMQLRRQEMAIQQSLGMRCPEDEYGYGYHHGYHEGYQDGYHQGY
ncbi:coiled-coil domain-containing protein 80 [Xyrauchen texanus]|uniref:coiled-coil domain-containing protein 80 n=1 Tax=Xyrauchen texanus TaxID=154827 RepID=UPI0022423CB6|nr:coiled-coil domain-containing protein 80 [Xyrauchen texanus]XP_051998193.1 coiled-coil domain-containing protein 80 [Xyrauchen texanus]